MRPITITANQKSSDNTATDFCHGTDVCLIRGFDGKRVNREFKPERIQTRQQNQKHFEAKGNIRIITKGIG